MRCGFEEACLDVGDRTVVRFGGWEESWRNRLEDTVTGEGRGSVRAQVNATRGTYGAPMELLIVSDLTFCGWSECVRRRQAREGPGR
jgi:hypothetical protein